MSLDAEVCDNNDSFGQSQHSLDLQSGSGSESELLGMKIKPFTQLERRFITDASTAHENSDGSDLSPFHVIRSDRAEKPGQILETATEVLSRSRSSLYM